MIHSFAAAMPYIIAGGLFVLVLTRLDEKGVL